MRITVLFFAAILKFSGLLQAQSIPQELFVQSSHADVLESPGSRKPRVNRVYTRQAVTVYEVRQGWAQTSPPGYTPRWIEMRLLGPVRPAEAAPVRSSAIFADPRIEEGALATRPGDGVDSGSIEMLWRAARKALDNGCSQIINGDKSVSRPDTFYIACRGETRNRFYTVRELTQR